MFITENGFLIPLLAYLTRVRPVEMDEFLLDNLEIFYAY